MLLLIDYQYYIFNVIVVYWFSIRVIRWPIYWPISEGVGQKRIFNFWPICGQFEEIDSYTIFIWLFGQFVANFSSNWFYVKIMSPKIPKLPKIWIFLIKFPQIILNKKFWGNFFHN